MKKATGMYCILSEERRKLVRLSCMLYEERRKLSWNILLIIWR